VFSLFLESPVDRVRVPPRLAEISPSEFYSSQPTPTTTESIPAWEEQLRLHRRAAASALASQTRFFAKQQAAFDNARPSERVFAEEIGSPAAAAASAAEPSCGTSSGGDSSSSSSSTQPAAPVAAPQLIATRRFFCATYSALWERHNAIQPEQRHLYEVIAEDAPAKLYIDAEFIKAHNLQVDGEAVSHAVRSLILSRLSSDAGVTTAAVAPIVELDSSTADKWSRHIIFCGAIFENNAVMGEFVRDAVAVAMQDEASPLAVCSPRGTRQCVIDLGVYTRNRHFRMLGSCKFGRTATLQPTRETRELFDSEHDLFMAALICNVSALSSFVSPKPRGAAAAAAAISQGSHHHQHREAAAGSSPFPMLDQFVTNIVQTMGGASGGFIRSSLYFPSTRQVVYNIGGNRYCERIQRQHKSNHVMIVCSLAMGVWYQKCLDPECSRDFRSNERPIPPDVLASTQ